jgi:hypothetical protein
MAQGLLLGGGEDGGQGLQKVVEPRGEIRLRATLIIVVVGVDGEGL